LKALVGLALLLAHGAAVAEPCPLMGLESEVLQTGEPQVGSEGGIVVGELPVLEPETKPNPSRAGWKVRTKSKQTAAKESVIAPGLVVYHPLAGVAQYELLDARGKSAASATVSAKLPDLLDAPRIRAVRSGMVGPRHPSFVVDVELEGRSPKGVIALVLQKAKGRPISWGRASSGMTNVKVYDTHGGCVTVFSEGSDMAQPDERVVAFWVDETGRRSRVSPPILVEKAP
jgi:hypothetical protein